MDIPRVNRLAAFRDSFKMSSNPTAIFSKYQKKLGSTYYFYFGGIRKVMVTSSPEIIQHILRDNYTNYHKSEIQLKRMGHFLGNGLLTSHGDYWLTQRRLIQEGFKRDKLKSYTRNMDRIVMKTCDKMKSTFHDEPIGLSSFLKRLTFEIVIDTLFSNNLTRGEIDKICTTITKTQKFIIRQIVQPYLNGWFRLSGELKKHERNRFESDRIIKSIIRNRKNSETGNNDLLHTLINAKYEETGSGMSDKQILMESMQLIVAGHETSSTALTWILYLLSQHPDCFKRVKDEISSQMQAGVPNIGNLSEYEYTIRVIKESLRLYPPFWMLDREAVKDDQASGFSIPGGTTVLLFIHGVHHSSKYWTEPEKFDPERFNKANSRGHQPFTHLPFGAGPRGCIGEKYAMLQMLIILYRLIGSYDISIQSPDKMDINPMIILRPKEEIFFNFKPIS